MTSLPLAGFHVLDFTHGAAGPFATMILADLGADVVKVERPGRGDSARFMNGSQAFRSGIPDGGGDYFLSLNRNKRSLALDLKRAEGLDLAARLAKRADIVVQNFRPGVMQKLGLDYETLSSENPGLIYGSLSAYGEAGPAAGQPGMDVAIQARSGVMAITGNEGDGPVKPGVSLADLSGGLHLAIGILGAALAREKGGGGQEIKVSLLDSTMMMLINYSVSVLDGSTEVGKLGTGHPQLAPFQAFPTADGSIVLAIGTNRLFRQLCEVLGLERLAEDARYSSNEARVANRTELEMILTTKLRERVTDEWQATFEQFGIPSSPVKSLTDAFRDPQLEANGMVVQVEHPLYGLIHQLGSPFHYSKTAAREIEAPPVLGADTNSILKEVLNLSDDEICQLGDIGAI